MEEVVEIYPNLSRNRTIHIILTKGSLFTQAVMCLIFQPLGIFGYRKDVEILTQAHFVLCKYTFCRL